jgi:hypothetical protein
MHETVACQICGRQIAEHWQFVEHFHRPHTAAEVRAVEWAATKAKNRLDNQVERLERRGRWQQPLARRLMQLKVKYR